MAASLAHGSMALSDLSMQIRATISLVMVTALALSTLLVGTAWCDSVDDTSPVWEISIQTTVNWPPIASPHTKKSKGAGAEGDADAEDTGKKFAAATMITERTLQASLSGQLLTITGNTVEFAPTLGGGKPVPIPLESISSLRRAAPANQESGNPEAAPAKAIHKPTATKSGSTERLVTFRAGSSVPGRLLRVTEQGLVLAFGESGELTVPLAEILSITPLHSDGNKFGKLPLPEGRHVARLTTGEIITGNIAPVSSERDRLTISSPILTGEFPLPLIESLLFPVDTESPAPHPNASSQNAGRVFFVNFGNGASLTSPKIALSNGMLELEIWEGAPFRIPLASAESISCLHKSGIRPNGPILLWGAAHRQNGRI